MTFIEDCDSTGRETSVTEPFKIDQMYDSDWEDVRRIYLEGIKTGNVSGVQLLKLPFGFSCH